MIIFALIVWLCIYAVFLFGPIYLMGLFICRHNAWWNERDKIQKYFKISSPKTAMILIGTYSGYSTHIQTNIPLFYSKYRVNSHPSRLSALGAVNYVVTLILAIWYAVGITAYFFFGWANNPMIFSGLIFLMIHGIIFSILCNWNKSHVRLAEYEVISKKEMKERRHYHGT